MARFKVNRLLQAGGYILKINRNLHIGEKTGFETTVGGQSEPIAFLTERRSFRPKMREATFMVIEGIVVNPLKDQTPLPTELFHGGQFVSIHSGNKHHIDFSARKTGCPGGFNPGQGPAQFSPPSNKTIPLSLQAIQ
jgi:hypothetical protein